MVPKFGSVQEWQLNLETNRDIQGVLIINSNCLTFVLHFLLSSLTPIR